MNLLNGLRICFIAGTLGTGGAERQLYNILKALIENGAKPVVLELLAGEYWETEIRKLGIPVMYVGNSRNRFFRTMEICRAVNLFKPQIIQSQHFYTNPYAAVSGRTGKSKSIGAIRNDLKSEFNSVGTLYGKFCLKSPDMIAANSIFGMQKAIGSGRSVDTIYYLPNCIDTKQFDHSRNQKQDIFQITGIGRLTIQKRFDRLLHVIVLLQKITRKPFLLSIYGEGPLKNHLIEMAKSLDIEHLVHFWGVTQDIPSALQKSDLLVLTSDWEGTPNVVLEAMASGVPVLATDVGGVPDLIKNGETGYLFDREDLDGMARMISNIIGNPEIVRDTVEVAKEFLKANYSIELLPAKLSELYQVTLYGKKNVFGIPEAISDRSA